MTLPASPRPSPSRLTLGFLALLDYDGTITTRECNEVVLQQLTGDAWRPFEDDVHAGRISHIQCLRKQVALIRAPRTEFLGALVAEAAPTPGLAAFLDTLAQRNGRAAVVSAGFREAIEAFWRREALPAITTYAGELVATSPDGGPPFDLAFSESFGDCPRCGPGGCKAAVLRAQRRPGDVVLVFGDGAGDVCMAREADLTFARGHLAERCAAEGLEWRPLRDYTTVWSQVDEWLDVRGRGNNLEPSRARDLGPSRAGDLEPAS